MAASVKVVVAGTGPAPGPAAAVPDPGPRPADPAVLRATATCARGPGLPTAAVTGDDPGPGLDNPGKQQHETGHRQKNKKHSPIVNNDNFLFEADIYTKPS